MHSDLVELGWTEEHFNRIDSVLTEEAQKARIAAQLLAMESVDSSTVAVPGFRLGDQDNPALVPRRTARRRLSIGTDPDLFLTKISVNVAVRTRDAADPKLEAVLAMFRRAANYVARIEDALVFNGRFGPGLPPLGIGGIPPAYNVSGGSRNDGLLGFVGQRGQRSRILLPVGPGGLPSGNAVAVAITQAVSVLEGQGQFGPYACALSPALFGAVCTPTPNLILPRDRILPFLQGPLLRASVISRHWGIVVSLNANPIELVVGSDIHLRFLQTTEEPRMVFQVAERVALRIKDTAAIALLTT